MNTSCHGDNWTTVGCCYSNDNGSSCDTATLHAEANAIYAEWIGKLINITNVKPLLKLLNLGPEPIISEPSKPN